MAQRNIVSEMRRNNKTIAITGSSIAILLAPVTCRDDSDIGEKAPHSGGRDIFRDFQRENKLNLWNKPLAESVRELTYLGWLEPGTLFVQGTDRGLDGLREAFSRRVLKPPRNYTIHNLGNVPSIQMTNIQQAQFIPLTEVLCLIISELNKRKINANQEVIRGKLSECYNHITLPSMEIIYKSLTHLLNQGKIRHNGIGYIALDQSVPLDSEFDDYLLNSAYYIKPEQTEKTYLMFKDGQITKHSLPKSVSDKSTQTLEEKQEQNIVKTKTAAVSKVESPKVQQKQVPVKHPGSKTLPAKSPVLHSFDDSLVFNTLKPEYSRPGLQRSLSMRERKSKSLNRSNFDRTKSMRTGRVYAEDDMLLTSDSEYKTSCLGRLFTSKHHSKNHAKHHNKNILSPTVPAKQAKTSNSPNKRETFCAQFPPSDIHDPFFNHVRWLNNENTKKNSSEISSNFNDDQSVITTDSFGIPRPPRETKSLPKDATKVNVYRMETGHLSSKAQSLQMKYKEAQQESMPESEAEFLKPTKLYDNKHRTKAVSQQTNTKTGKVNPSTKEDKIKHYFQSLRDTSPIKIQPFQGVDNESFCNDSELDYRPQKENTRGRANNVKSKVRDKSRERPKKRHSQKYDSESQTSTLTGSEGLPVPPGMHNGDISDSGSSVYVDKYPHHPHYEVLTSDTDQTLSSHDSEMPIQYRTLVNANESKKPHPQSLPISPISNQFKPVNSGSNKQVHSSNKQGNSSNKPVQSSNKQVNASNKPVQSSNKQVNSSNKPVQSSIRQGSSSNKPVQSSNQSINNQMGDRRVSAPIVVSSRPPIQIPPEPLRKNSEYYYDEEIDQLMRGSPYSNEERPLLSPVQAIRTFSAYPEFSSTKSNSQDTLDSGRNTCSISLTSSHNYETVPTTTSYHEGHQYSQINIRGPDITNGNQHKTYMNGNMNVQPNLNRGPPIHNRIESLSSTGDGDSGFNSPRSSVAHNRNSSTPIEIMSPERLKSKTSPTKLSNKPEYAKLEENVDNYDRPHSRNRKKNRPKSYMDSEHSSVSDLTVKTAVSKDRKHSDNSSSSDKSGASNLRRKQQNGKRHHKSYELIGML
ncbi:uncharacterized protein [Antedon mediterranea]|uniref:uncharacterized protein n=1 Tax=Antedon mediterranea TaxID=105859 RepID=UPI003AF6E5E9